MSLDLHCGLRCSTAGVVERGLEVLKALAASPLFSTPKLLDCRHKTSQRLYDRLLLGEIPVTSRSDADIKESLTTLCCANEDELVISMDSLVERSYLVDEDLAVRSDILGVEFKVAGPGRCFNVSEGHPRLNLFCNFQNIRHYTEEIVGPDNTARMLQEIESLVSRVGVEYGWTITDGIPWWDESWAYFDTVERCLSSVNEVPGVGRGGIDAALLTELCGRSEYAPISRFGPGISIRSIDFPRGKIRDTLTDLQPQGAEDSWSVQD